MLSRQLAPVDRLLFLRARATVKQTESAFLLSSEAGIIRWWGLYGGRKELGESRTRMIILLNI
jgi:hypothetical protein